MEGRPGGPEPAGEGAPAAPQRDEEAELPSPASTLEPPRWRLPAQCGLGRRWGRPVGGPPCGRRRRKAPLTPSSFQQKKGKDPRGVGSASPGGQGARQDGGRRGRRGGQPAPAPAEGAARGARRGQRPPPGRLLRRAPPQGEARRGAPPRSVTQDVPRGRPWVLGPRVLGLPSPSAPSAAHSLSPSPPTPAPPPPRGGEEPPRSVAQDVPRLLRRVLRSSLPAARRPRSSSRPSPSQRTRPHHRRRRRGGDAARRGGRSPRRGPPGRPWAPAGALLSSSAPQPLSPPNPSPAPAARRRSASPPSAPVNPGC